MTVMSHVVYYLQRRDFYDAAVGLFRLFTRNNIRLVVVLQSVHFHHWAVMLLSHSFVLVDSRFVPHVVHIYYIFTWDSYVTRDCSLDNILIDSCFPSKGLQIPSSSTACCLWCVLTSI